MRFIYLFILLHVCYATIDEYNAERAQIIRDEALLSLGGDTPLTDKEQAVNNCLMLYKFREADYGYNNPRAFNFSQHFFSYKNVISKSKVYKIIKDMPKGGALHVHDMGILGPDYIMNLTYKDNLYVCPSYREIQFRFSGTTPMTACNGNWALLKDLREAYNDTITFDVYLRKYFTMYCDSPDMRYPSIKESWGTFMKYFRTVIDILTYRPVWEQYFYDALLKFREEKVMYIELRSILPSLYDLDGTVYSPTITALTYNKVINRFKKDYPDFFGAKLIYAPSRRIDRSQLDEHITLAKSLKKSLPDLFAGFDLVGQEDLGSPLVEFIPQLLAASKDLNYFFHAGETNWYGTLTDENIIDAILLGAKRLGHAYGIIKHPLLMKAVKNKGIGIEVNVISNNVLSLVRDLRNHPLSTFLAQGLPVVLSSDDPGIWEADVLSDDFYVAFMGVASRLSDLRLIKKLIYNSLEYSALNKTMKTSAKKHFKANWDVFVNNFSCSKY